MMGCSIQTPTAQQIQMISLQKATQNDVDYLVSLRKLTMHSYLLEAGMPCSEQDHLARVNYQFAATHLIVFDGNIVGMVKFANQLETGCCYIYQLQIHPDFQNKQLGSQVMALMIENAKVQQLDVVLSVIKQNLAYGLYLKLGFQVVGEDYAEYLMRRPRDHSYQHLLERDVLDDPLRMSALNAVRQLNIPSAYIAAGFLRNLVWDKLHGKTKLSGLNDVDVIYFDQNETDHNIAKNHQASLVQLMPNVNWQVKNQALMHIKNHDNPYRCLVDAMRYWPEKETAVAVKLNHMNQLTFISGFGFESLFNLSLRYNPKRDKAIFLTRLNNKKWQEKWPKLTLEL